jgi:hypothetical protein
LSIYNNRKCSCSSQSKQSSVETEACPKTDPISQDDSELHSGHRTLFCCQRSEPNSRCRRSPFCRGRQDTQEPKKCQQVN